MSFVTENHNDDMVNNTDFLYDYLQNVTHYLQIKQCKLNTGGAKGAF